MNHEADASYKTPFAAPEVVRDFIPGFIPDEWLHGLDYRPLERVSVSYVTDDLRDRADDIACRVQRDGEWVYLYMIPKPPGLLVKYLLHLEYFLIDERQYDVAELAPIRNPVAVAIRFERPEGEASLLASIDR